MDQPPRALGPSSRTSRDKGSLPNAWSSPHDESCAVQWMFNCGQHYFVGAESTLELALAESGRLTPIPLEFWPLDRINEVYERVKHGQVAGRAVIALTVRAGEPVIFAVVIWSLAVLLAVLGLYSAWAPLGGKM